MKKQSLKSLKLNKKCISNIQESQTKGGRTYIGCTDGTYNCPASWITRCNASHCICQ
ncbi:hypothetical protein [Kordia sp.]|uniref:hypothetical protein n=1 Tax=Kordia sp. TaxID=1965332 RepID=UPI003D6A54AC